MYNVADLILWNLSRGRKKLEFEAIQEDKSCLTPSYLTRYPPTPIASSTTK